MFCHCVLLHLKVLGETGGGDRGPSKELHQATRRTKTIHASAGREVTDASTDKAFSFFFPAMVRQKHVSGMLIFISSNCSCSLRALFLFQRVPFLSQRFEQLAAKMFSQSMH